MQNVMPPKHLQLLSLKGLNVIDECFVINTFITKHSHKMSKFKPDCLTVLYRTAEIPQESTTVNLFLHYFLKYYFVVTETETTLLWITLFRCDHSARSLWKRNILIVD